jgi:alkylated DNA repair dioxygenase AlkB
MLFENKPIKLAMPDAEVLYFPCFFDLKESAMLLGQLKEKIAWQQDTIKFYGKTIPLPRLTAWYGDEGKNYQYSGIKMQPQMWNEELLLIKHKIEQVANNQFNSVLLNFYRNGQDSMAWHADDEPELGKNPVIASVSFGQERLFKFKHRKNTDLKAQITLENGSLLLMAGQTQHYWLHQIPKSTRTMKDRINLTFRTIKSVA